MEIILSRQGIPVTKWPLHAQWVRPSGHASGDARLRG
jgi:hypothetical protein